MKRLYKSTTNKVITGFIGGLAEYMNTDPVLLRVVFVFILIFTGVIPATIAYLVASMIVPNAPLVKTETAKTETTETKTETKTETTTEPATENKSE